MYITVIGIQNGEPVSLVKTLSVCASAELEVALCGLTYNHRWYNICSAHKNNKVVNGEHVTQIPDGYYNVCELNEDVFELLGAEFHLHTPTGRLQMSASKRLVLNRGLVKLLGFARDEFEPGKTYIADEPHRLAIHLEICVHLVEISTSDNQHNGRPSTLLRSVPVENEKCEGGRTETFPILHYKTLESGAFPQLTLMVLDVSGKQLSFDYLSATLHIRNGWRAWPSERQKMPWGRFGWSRWHRTYRPGRKGRSVICFPPVWRGVQKKGSHPWRGGVTIFGELSDIDTSHAVPKRIHTLAFTGSKWVAFADPLQQTGWLIDIKIISPHRAQSGRWWIVAPGCALISPRPKTSLEAQDKLSYILKTSNSRQGTLKMVSEFFPAGIIGLGQASSTILLEIFLGDRPDDFVDVLPGFKLKWPQKHANEKTGVRILVKEILKWI